MKVRRFRYVENSSVSKFWVDAAKAVCTKMSPLELSDELVVQERQIWNEVERVCSQLGYDR